MSKNGVLGFSISYLVLEIIRFLAYVNEIAYDLKSYRRCTKFENFLPNI